jgi:choice-of-anchor B domain-containing protein
MKAVYNGKFSRYATLLSIVVLCLVGKLLAQAPMNVTLLSNWDNNALPTTSGYTYNDVWGYASGGREYAFIGANAGVFAFDITIATSPVQVALMTSACVSTVWRDFETYSHYLYVVSDNCLGSTLQIWDLAGLPGSVTKVYDNNTFFSTCHDIAICQSSGRLYAAGTNTKNTGVVILDLATNPVAPTQLAAFNLGAYCHDFYVYNDTLFAFMGASGLRAFDFHNVATPGLFGALNVYPESGYAHSGWGAHNNDYLYWADETNDKGIHWANISNPSLYSCGGTFRSALMAPTHTNSVPHNPMVAGNLLFVSYYHDGLQIWDISAPTAPVRVGYFDTYASADYAGLVGAWGVYPFLPSGNILVSDTQNGLFVLQYNSIFPVTLADFSVSMLQDKVRLTWATETESNNSGFVVERSSDGDNFEALETVPGAGNSSTRLEYATYDKNPVEGNNYYRLKQVDFDGNSTYSEIEIINFSIDRPELVVYPSPARAGEKLHVEINTEMAHSVELSVFDMMGRKLTAEMLDITPGQQVIDLNTTSAWASGTYLVRLQGPGWKQEQKLQLTR